MVKTSLSSARGTDSISGQGAKIPHALGPKKPKNKTSNIVTNSIKTLKMVHIKKKLKKKKYTINPRATTQKKKKNKRHN